MHLIQHISVLVPACNEENLLPRCLTSILCAQQLLPKQISSDVVVCADASTDRTIAIAREMLRGRGTVVSIDAQSVGVARSRAAREALRRFNGPVSACWLANTDADCVVPSTWLLQQLQLAAKGVHAVAGIVTVEDFSEHEDFVERKFHESYRLHSDGTHPHIHGANIGIRADVYRAAGGWASLETAEDHDLWRRISQYGFERRSISALHVVTSGRRVGRAPHGFAQALAAHNGVTA